MNERFSTLAFKYSDLAGCTPEIQAAFGLLRNTYRNGKKVMVCGNGGSSADSEHIVAELMKGFLSGRAISEPFRARLAERFPENGAYLAGHLQGALPAISLVSQSALTTAFANDVAPDMVFAQQVYGYGEAGDALIAISTSGESKSVIHATQVAKILGVATVGLTGKTGGRLKDLCDVCICVPYGATSDVQERHMAIYHALCAALEAEFFPDD
jgi:D-sedoheptulose 7-phosphate isomerase